MDFDGVLNSIDWWRRRGSSNGWDPLQNIDPRAVGLLNQLVDRTGAVVVISSDWRKLYPERRLSDLLAKRGFHGRVVGTTPDLWYMPRGHEIRSWLDQHPEVQRFVIIDDQADMAMLQPYLVKTTFDRGLEPVHVERAARLLEAR